MGLLRDGRTFRERGRWVTRGCSVRFLCRETGVWRQVWGTRLSGPCSARRDLYGKPCRFGYHAETSLQGVSRTCLLDLDWGDRIFGGLGVHPLIVSLPCGPAEEGIPLRDIAATIGRGLKIPVVSISPEEAIAHFGRVGAYVGLDLSASSAITRQRLGWLPTGPGTPRRS